MTPDLKLISMDEIKAEEVKWLWYPYLPRGKLTIVQGDPGEGKTTFVLAVIAALTRGETLPESEQVLEPLTVIYQTAEDGLADTIKPRLESAGADCSRVLVIDESQRELTLCDERLEQAVQQTGAQLIVLDPIQAYLGCDVDMHRANEVRPVLKRVAAMAERTGCAVILIGHMNKAQGLKSGYCCMKMAEAEEWGEEVSDYLFVNDEGQLFHPDIFTKHLRMIYEELGFPKEYHLHTLRHYFVTTLLHHGVDKQTVAELAGHGDTSFLERTYCHPQLVLKQQAASIMEDSLLHQQAG